MREDGRTHVLFLQDGEPTNNSSSRLGLFRSPEGSASFLGMYVRDELRGSGAAKAIAQYFLDYCSKHGLATSETATIRKPLISLVLERAGFTPLPGGTRVTILPNLESSTSQVPVIVLGPTETMPTDAVDRSPAGAFYHLVDERTATRTHPSVGPFTEATIHTKFLPPSN